MTQAHSTTQTTQTTHSDTLDSTHMADLRRHADTLWAVYTRCVSIDTALARDMRAIAETAFSLHQTFSKISTRHENELFRAKRQKLSEAIGIREAALAR